MDKLNIYRNGNLPNIAQTFHSPQLHLLRSSYWALQQWNHNNLSAPFWRLYWNNQTGATITHNNKKIHLRPDRLILIAPHTPFTSQLNKTTAPKQNNTLIGTPITPQLKTTKHLRHLFIHFTLTQPTQNNHPNISNIPLHQDNLQTIQDITTALTQNRHHLNQPQSHALHSLIHFALRTLPNTTWAEHPLDKRIQKILTYIEHNLQHPLSNKTFGQQAHMSPNAFTRLFKQQLGKTPMAHLNQRRIEKASILLHHTEDSLEKIAEQCGYADRNYLSRTFKKNLNIPPATYRKKRAL